ncbi:MAG: cation:proton antiporter [Candidatus Omnitrophica bacterium]|nr:cation:proton antiporter [Candidatus Omnitrophota bacterium]
MSSELLLFDIGLIILVSTVLAYFAHLFRQPLVPAYTIAGLILGPVGFGWITNTEIITILSELGIAFLLFIVGMEIDFQRLKDVKLVSFFGGMTQIVLILGLTFFTALYFGFSQIQALYLGLILTFSSTMVVVKYFSDENMLDTLHGKIVLGFLLVQDIFAIVALSILMNLSEFSVAHLLPTFIGGFGLFIAAIVAKKYIYPVLFDSVVKTPELLYLSSLSVCFIFAGIAHAAGYSIAIGAFIAGLSLAAYPYDLEIINRVGSLRDFFATLFFVSLGMQITSFSILTVYMKPLIALALIALLIKPLIIFTTSTFFGYEQRTSFFASTSLGQISEFSLIIALQGLLIGAIPMEIFSMTVVLAVFTMSLSTYVIRFRNALFSFFSKYLIIFRKVNILNRQVELGHEPEKKGLENHIILWGAHRIGSGIVDAAQKLKKNIIVVDYNPDIIKTLMNEKVPCIYGNLDNLETLDRVNVDRAKLIISTVPNFEYNMFLLEQAKVLNKEVPVILTANALEQALFFYNKGADYVILPKRLSRDKVKDYVYSLFNKHKRTETQIRKIKEGHVKELKADLEEQILDRYEPRPLKLDITGTKEKRNEK